ncbi:MAG: MspA family porin [Mycobacterium sp.]
MRVGGAVCVALLALAGPAAVVLAGPAAADPVDPSGPDVQPVVAADPAPPVDDGKVPSSPPKTTKSPDGWALTISSEDEILRPVAPLTTALSSREYQVGGTFVGSLKGPGEAPKGVFEVGYQIGCGIDMTTGNGVLLSGTGGLSAGLTTLGPLSISGAAPVIIFPTAGVNIGGTVGVSLKPGLVNVVPIVKKTFEGSEPWVSISNQRLKIDGCVGQSFIRSYAILNKSTDEGDAIAAWYGFTKMV